MLISGGHFSFAKAIQDFQTNTLVDLKSPEMTRYWPFEIHITV